jgi:hypothetical protein
MSFNGVDYQRLRACCRRCRQVCAQQLHPKPEDAECPSQIECNPPPLSLLYLIGLFSTNKSPLVCTIAALYPASERLTLFLIGAILLSTSLPRQDNTCVTLAWAQHHPQHRSSWSSSFSSTVLAANCPGRPGGHSTAVASVRSMLQRPRVVQYG